MEKRILELKSMQAKAYLTGDNGGTLWNITFKDELDFLRTYLPQIKTLESKSDSESEKLKEIRRIVQSLQNWGIEQEGFEGCKHRVLEEIDKLTVEGRKEK